MGRIFDVQRFSIHDGPGIRTLVFMKGCPLRCAWCHNPEGTDAGPVLSFQPDRCIGCDSCLRACPHGAHRKEDGLHVLDRGLCEACGECAKECYAGALELVGRDATAEEVLDEVLRDRPFYETSGGGMTLSGGEPVMQMEFTEALLRGAKEEGLHCCVETCGAASLASFERVLPLVDLFLYDIKDTDEARHVEFTGAPLGPIIENLKALHERGARIILRLPLVPGLNDRDDHFRAVAALVKSLPALRGVGIMPYHTLGEGKLDRFGLSREGRFRCEPPEKELVARWGERLAKLGVPLPAESGAKVP